MEVTALFVRALEGEIIEKYMKEGVTDVNELWKHVHEELPQLVCDHVNSMLKQAYEEGARESRAQLEEFCHTHGIIVFMASSC